MIKINSISGVVRYVKDIDATAAFYEKLGFRFGNKDEARLTCYVNWFWVEFHKSDDAGQTATEQLAVSAEGIDELHESLVAKGIKPLTEPQDMPWGRREFTVADPDGYKILFFNKKK